MRAHRQFTSKYSSKIGDERKETEGNDYEKSLLTKLFEQIWRTWLDSIWFCLHRATYRKKWNKNKSFVRFFLHSAVVRTAIRKKNRFIGRCRLNYWRKWYIPSSRKQQRPRRCQPKAMTSQQRHADVFRWKSLIIHIMHSVHYCDNCSIFSACIIYKSRTYRYIAFVCFMFSFDQLLILLSQPQSRNKNEEYEVFLVAKTMFWWCLRTDSQQTSSVFVTIVCPRCDGSLKSKVCNTQNERITHKTCAPRNDFFAATTPFIR